MDYRLGKGEGPSVGGTKLFENFGVNVLATASSGQPYTPQVEPFSQIDSKAPVPSGGINSARMPWKNRIDVRFDRKFSVGSRSTLSAFVWVQNLLDSQRTRRVSGALRVSRMMTATCATAGGQQFLGSSAPPVAETLYRHRNRIVGQLRYPTDDAHRCSS